DEATAWLRSDAPANATLETYPNDPQEAAVPHGMTVYRPSNRNATPGGPKENGLEWMLAVRERCPDYIELTYHEGIMYAAPNNWSERARIISWSQRRQYVLDLLAGDRYPYRVAETFGPRPAFLDGEPRPSRLRELLQVGLYPRTIQYGDPQDFGVNQYTVILERTGRCGASGGNGSAPANDSASANDSAPANGS
ncbi:hypothetical protein ACFQE1_21215, partial [Halobium palmae]